MRLGAECKHCNEKPEKFVNNHHADIHSLTALRDKVLRVGILGEDARMAAHRNFGIYALFHHNCERSIQGCAHFQGSRRLISSVIWIIARASVGVARINLIEHIIEYLPIVHVGLEAG